MSTEDKPHIFRKSYGPIAVRGDIELRDEEGNVIETNPIYSLCGCGQSLKMPFCDGEHKKLPDYVVPTAK